MAPESVASPPAGTTLSHDERPSRRTGAPPARAHLFLALECDRPLAASARYQLSAVDAVTIGRGSDRAAVRVDDGAERRLVVRVPDAWMSSTHARLSKVLGRWVLEDAGSRNGTVVNGVAQDRVVLADGDLCELGHTLFLFREALPTAPEEPHVLDAAELRPPAPGLATLLPPFARDLALLAAVARSTVSVVIRGESGTGKELVARAVHALSGRAGAFVAMNCGALPDTLIESELFGHRRGAFSGATEDRPGLVRSADRGTLFLDEIGDLPNASQAAFLRVLQEREVVPVGAAAPVKVDVRLVAATHRDVAALVDEGEFRGDLLARIAGYTAVLPPLRERREDLGLLVATLLRRALGDGAQGVQLSLEAARELYRREWALNVRELEKCLETAAVVARSTAQRGGRVVIEPEHLPAGARAAGGPMRALTEEEQRHRDRLEALLREHGGNVTEVAKACGKARMQIHRWAKRYGLELDRYRR